MLFCYQFSESEVSFERYERKVKKCIIFVIIDCIINKSN